MRLFRVLAGKTVGISVSLALAVTTLIAPAANAAVPLVPSAPWDPKITSVSNTAVTLTWQDPLENPASVVSYTIQQTTDDATWTDAVTGITPTIAGVYTRVLPVSLGIVYRFRVVAKTTSLGDSPAAVAVDASTQYTQIAAGTSHTCAVTASGSVYCWGSNAQGQLGTGNTTESAAPVLVSGVSNVTAIAAGGAHTCALIADGTIKCWGDNIAGQLGDTTTTDRLVPTTVSGITAATSIATGSQHSCATITGGTVRCWGLNASGQLGNGNTTSSPVSIAITGISTATQVSAGLSHSCVRLSTGAVRCWGLGSLGQLGNGLGTDSLTPVAVGLSSDTAVSVRLGDYHSCAVLLSGAIECWGSNSAGQLGDGSTTPSDTPVAVAGIGNAISVAPGGNHTCARLASNEVICFGANTSGQIGDGTFTNRTSAVVLGGLEPTAAISAGSTHTCIVLSAGPALCWGGGASGQLGDGGKSNRYTPTNVESSTAIAVSVGNSHSCALTTDGVVKCWGLNTSGQLGDGTTSPTTKANPTAALGISSAVSVAAGSSHTCAALSDGTVWCWGNNVLGQLGDGTNATRTLPVQVSGVSSAVSVTAGVNHTCALLADGSATCWGSNGSGQLGNGTGVDSSTPVAVSAIADAISLVAGYQGTCAILSNNSTYCWGQNNLGQLGDGTTTNRLAPQIIPGLSARQVQVGRNHSCAVLTTGAVRCWGANTFGQIGDGTTTARLTPTQVTGITSGASTVTVGDTFACVVMTAGTVQCWGANVNGELGNGTNSNSSVPVTVTGLANAASLDSGISHTCAATSLGTVRCWGINTSGQLGDLTTSSRNTPVKVSYIDSALIAPSTVADAPTGVTAVAGDASATISWTAPNANGSAIVGYTVSSSPASAGCTTTTALTCVVSGLSNGTAYTFTVVAVNGRGNSPASTASNSITPAAPPSAPTNVVAVRGDTKATVSWTAAAGNGSAVTGYTVTSTPGSFTCTTLGATSCEVTGLTNGTAYTFVVTAVNAVSSSVDSLPSAAVTPAGVPFSVTGVTLTRTATSATVTWTASNSNGAAVTGYSVTLNGGTPCLTAANVLTCTFSGLSSSAAYAVSITAINAVGNSIARVVAAPSAVQVTRGDTQATVTWTAPVGGDFAATSFSVQAINATSLAVVSTCTNVVGVDTANTCVFTGLTNGTAYFFRVVATDSNGNTAAAADSANATPAAVPSAPTAVTAVRGDGSATVSWTAGADNGAAITGYTVTSTPGSFTCTTSATTCVVSGLTNGTAYTFTVVATNAIGDSAASSASNSVTAAKVPDAPTSVLVTGGSGSVLVSWTAPSGNGEAVTSYTVTSNPGGLTCNTAGLSCTVNGLTNGTSYTFTVTATNAVGTSTSSAASTSVTPAGVPTAPSSVQVTRGDTQVTVSWQASSSNGSPITSYSVVSSPAGFTCNTVIGVDINPLSCVVTGLTNGTAYTFTVKATNALGDSLFSSTSASVTPARVPTAPTAPTATPGDASVTVGWSASDGNGEAVSSYTVTASPGGLTCTTSNLSCIVTGLTNGTTYTFTIVATNAVGNSAASVATSSVAPAGKPILTTPVSVTRGDTQATISWPAANSNGSTLTGYTVTSVPTSAGCTTSSTSCVITGLTNGVAYTFSVTATNGEGTSTAVTSASTYIGVVPGAPSGAVATRLDQGATLNWTAAADNGAAITKYTVTSTPGSFTCTTNGATTCNVTGLSNGTAYTFTVVATNVIGDSVASPASNSLTPAGKPILSGVVTTVRGDTQIVVSWPAAAANGEAVTGYTATAVPGGQFCTTTSAVTCTITGLTNGTNYIVNVVATNVEGNSAALSSSSTLVGVVPFATTFVSAVRGDQSALVSWSAADGRGLSVTGYTVTANPGGQTCTTGGTLNCTVLGLTNSTQYIFTVTATNLIGTSASSVASNTVVPAGAPIMTSTPTVTRGDTQATVSWTAANPNGDTITRYDVTSSPGGLTCQANGPTSCTVTGLTNGTSYTFAVTATNGAGTSVAASTASIVIGVAPTAPSSVTAVRGNQSAVVTWTPGDGRGQSIIRYTATSSPGGFFCTATSADSSCTVNGLTNGVAYTFTVTTTTLITTSDPSPVSSSVIPAGAPLAPTSITVLRGNQQVTVSWAAANANGDPIDTYTVTSSPGGFQCSVAASNANPISCVVPGLTNGTAYTFTVVAHNAVGNGTPGTSGTAIPATNPAPPTNVVAVRGDGSATVSWAAGSDNGAAISSYVVTSSPGGFTCTTATTSCQVSNLLNGVAYNFTVTAANVIGASVSSNASNNVTPAGAPSAPSAITVVRGNQQVTVSWAPASANGEAIDLYTVTSTPGGFQCTVSATNANPISCVVPGLTNGTSYTFSVVARNAVGSGSAGTSGSAIPATNPAVPTNVVAVRGDGTATVSWTAGADNGAAISGYTVTSSPGGLTCTSGSTSCVVSNLANGIAYTFTVVATNAVGASVSSGVSNSVTPAGVPTAPSSVTATRGFGQATVSWQGSLNSNGAAVTGYTATASPGGATCSTIVGSSIDPLSCVVTGLTNGVSYTFTVKAHNIVGFSPDSSVSLSVVPAGVPTAPSNVTAVRGDGSVQVFWSSTPTAEADGNGAAISSYRVTASDGTKTCTVSAPALTCTVSGLTNGASYTFTVTATNVVGTSNPSGASAAYVPAGAPTAPTTVTAVRGDQHATVSWSGALSNGSAITQYDVVSSPEALTCRAIGSTSCVVNGLTNGVAYTFTVVATNGISSSAPSSASNAATPAGLPLQPYGLTTVRGDRAVTVSWFAGGNNGAAITEFTVTANPGGATCVTSTTTCTVTNLSVGTSYTFVAVARNAVGSSLPSASAGPTAPAMPASPALEVTAATTLRTATVSWQKPANDNGSAVTGYRVVSTPGAKTCTTNSVDATSCDITLLAYGVSYTFTVYAINAGGDSVGATSAAVVPAGPPSPVTRLVTTSSAARTATIVFSGALLNGGQLTRYEYSYKLSTSSTWRAWVSTGAKLRAVIPNLARGKTYQFKFRLITSKGQVVSKPFTHVQTR